MQICEKTAAWYAIHKLNPSTKDEVWIGNSPHLLNAKQAINTLSKSTLPVLIYGHRGTGKIIAAKTIHCLSRGYDKPFIELECDHWRTKRLPQSIAELCILAKGGTLFFRNIDALNSFDTEVLKSFWIRSDSFQDTLPFNTYLSNNVRLIGSVSSLHTVGNTAVDCNNNYIQWLHYHSLTLELKTLSQRWRDIRSLVTYYQNNKPKLNQLTFTHSAWECLEQYTWPENVKQLERCLDKLNALVERGLITAEILVKYFPSMNKTQKTENILHLRRKVSDMNSNNGKWVDKKSLSNTEFAVGMPAPVSKALDFIQCNFANKISMSDVAKSACVSEPHLSYLLKKHKGESFKQLLIKRRIDEAVHLLRVVPARQVTLICNDVGFSDLSHFEKTFKKIIGVSPGRYRKHIIASSKMESKQA